MNKPTAPAALIISQQDFQDEEYFITKSVLEKAGITTITISQQKGECLGVFGGVVVAELSANQAQSADLGAIVFIGGNGMAKNLDNADFHRIIQAADQNQQIIAAICIAPSLLAKAGILKGKKATVWSSPMNKKGINDLAENGALYQDDPVVVDGRIITANGPSTARRFAETLVEMIKKV